MALIARTIEWRPEVSYEDMMNLWAQSKYRATEDSDQDQVRRYAIIKHTDTLFDNVVEMIKRAPDINVSIEPDKTHSDKDGNVTKFTYRIILSFIFNNGTTPAAQKEREDLLARQATIEEYLVEQNINYEKY